MGGPPGWYPSPPPQPGRQVPGAIVVLVTMLVGIGVLGSAVAAVRFLQGSDGPVDTAAAAEGLDGVVEDSDVDSESFDELDGCPFGATRSTIVQVVEPMTDESMTEVADTGSPDEAVVEVEGTPSVFCGLSLEDDEDVGGIEGIGLAAAPVDGDDVPAFVEEYTEQIAAADDVDFTPMDDHRGGQFFHFCARYEDEDDSDGVSDYCEVDWANEELLITLYVLGSASDSVDLDEAEQALAGSLDDLVDGLAGA
jgi:hypothetical protein